MKRREFLKTSLSVGLPAMVAPNLLSALEAKKKESMVGVQISPHSLLDEGIDNCLDQLKEKASVNTLFLYSHTYHMGYRPPNVMAKDHGVKVIDENKRNLPRSWIRHSEKLFKNATVKHQVVDSNFEYSKHNIFHEIDKPAKDRKMKVYARILEAGARRKAHIPGYSNVLTVDINGNPGRGPCWNHPAYREWVYNTVYDLVKNNPLDGLQYGAERTGPLSYLLFRGLIPTCFCEHCQMRHKKSGTNIERAKEGFRQLYNLIRGLEQGKKPPSDGVFTNVLRVFHKYPEVLTWDYQWFQADEEICSQVHKIAKGINPNIESGRHVDHQKSSWDVFYRSAVSYKDMTEQADFIKPILYHEILGPRLRWWVLERMKSRIFHELSLEQSLDLFYSIFNHNKKSQPSLEDLEKLGLSPEYVYQETRRCKLAVKSQAKVYSGIGIDVPWHIPGGMQARLSKKEQIEKSVQRAYDAGADGILASREYDEMTYKSLKVFGNTIRELHKS